MEIKKIKMGVISDTHLDHYNDKLKQCVSEHFKDVDIIVHAGDMVDFCVLDVFRDKEIKAVCGNMDNDSVRKKFPEQLFFDINGFQFALVHGWGSPWDLEDKLSARFKGVDCIIYGHTHKPANHERDGILFFNPGSAADRVVNSSQTVGILEIDKEIVGKIVKI
jgi:hypothetical protein